MSVTFNVQGLEGIKVPHASDSPNCNVDCVDYGCFDWVDAGFNVSNSNAHLVLSALELADDGDWYSGSVEPADLKGRALMALATIDDGGFELTVTRGLGATMIDCGMRAGYMHEKFNLLLGLADQAESLGTKVCWG